MATPPTQFNVPSFEFGFTATRPPRTVLPLTKYEHTRSVIEVNKFIQRENLENEDTNSVTLVGQHAENLLNDHRVSGVVVRKIGSYIIEKVDLR